MTLKFSLCKGTYWRPDSLPPYLSFWFWSRKTADGSVGFQNIKILAEGLAMSSWDKLKFYTTEQEKSGHRRAFKWRRLQAVQDCILGELTCEVVVKVEGEGVDCGGNPRGCPLLPFQVCYIQEPLCCSLPSEASALILGHGVGIVLHRILQLLAELLWGPADVCHSESLLDSELDCKSRLTEDWRTESQSHGSIPRCLRILH